MAAEIKNKLERFLTAGSPGKKLIVINSYDKVAMLSGLLQDCSGLLGRGTDILCFKSTVPDALSPFACRIKLSEDYLEHEDYLNINSYTSETVKFWESEAAKMAESVFTHRGVELARIAQYPLHCFLIPRVKALAVINRVMKEEKYGALLIIDSNGELSHIDEVLRRHYGVSSSFIGIEPKGSFKDILRRKMSSALSSVADGLGPLLLRKRKGAKLIDARLFYGLGIEDRNNFILAPFEKGLKLRLRCLFENGGYIAFRADNTKRLRLGGKTGFDINCLAGKFVFEGISYWELVEDRIRHLIVCDFARFKRNMDVFDNARRRHDIKCVILRNDVREIDKAIVLLSKVSAVCTLVVQHGVMAHEHGHNIIFADKLAVWGSRALRWYEGLGNVPSKMAVVGNPAFDRMRNNGSLEGRESIINRLGLAKRKHLITIIGCGWNMIKLSSFTSDDISSNLFQETIKAVKAIGDANVVIKLHPNEKAGAYAGLIGDENRAFTAIVETIDLEALIEASDAVITVGSTVGLDAVIMKKPLVVVNLTGMPDMIPFAEAKVALGVYRAEDIEPAIRQVLCNENTRSNMAKAGEDFIKDFVYKLDGRATERLLELVEGLSSGTER